MTISTNSTDSSCLTFRPYRHLFSLLTFWRRFFPVITPDRFQTEDHQIMESRKSPSKNTQINPFCSPAAPWSTQSQSGNSPWGERQAFHFQQYHPAPELNEPPRIHQYFTSTAPSGPPEAPRAKYFSTPISPIASGDLYQAPSIQQTYTGPVTHYSNIFVQPGRYQVSMNYPTTESNHEPKPKRAENMFSSSQASSQASGQSSHSYSPQYYSASE